MKKILVLIFLIFLAVNIFGNIIDDLISENYNEQIIPFGSKWLLCDLIINNNNLSIEFSSDTGWYPTIMAYRFTDEKIQLIIKNRLDKNEPDGLCWVMYYYVELFKNENNVCYNCYYIENLEKILNKNYTLNYGITNERNVRVREGPSTQYGIYKQLAANSIVKIFDTNEETETIVRMRDYWYKIEVDDKYFWIYGFYIDFPQRIKIK
jgi:hypothetical protein